MAAYPSRSAREPGLSLGQNSVHKLDSHAASVLRSAQATLPSLRRRFRASAVVSVVRSHSVFQMRPSRAARPRSNRKFPETFSTTFRLARQTGWIHRVETHVWGRV